MAATLTAIVLHWGPDTGEFRASGADPFDGCCLAPRDLRTPYDGIPSRDAVTLRAGSVVGTYRTAVRSVAALASWGPGEVVLRSGAFADVAFRATDGTTERWWNGSAWATATTSEHWTPAASLYDALPAYTPRTLGFVFRLSRAEARDPAPVVAGAMGVARLLFAQTRTGHRPASWHDDAVHRVFLACVREQATVQGAHEFDGQAGVSGRVRNYSAGVVESPYDVTGVEAVYDLSADPNFGAVVAGTWNGTAKTWTAAADLVAGRTYHSRFTFRPWVAFTADAFQVVDKTPAVLVTDWSVSARFGTLQPIPVVNRATGAAVLVDGPTEERLSLSGRIVAERETDALRIADALLSWLDTGAVAYSAATSLPVTFRFAPGGTPRSGNVIGTQKDITFVVEAGLRTWPGRERIGYTLERGGFHPTINGVERGG